MLGEWLNSTLHFQVRILSGPRIPPLRRLSPIFVEATQSQRLVLPERVSAPLGGVLTRFSGRFWGPVSGGCFRISGIFAPPRLRPVRNERRLGSHGWRSSAWHETGRAGASRGSGVAAGRLRTQRIGSSP